MRFQHYLLEVRREYGTSRSKSISEEEFNKLLSTSYSDAMDGTPIYRGVGSYNNDYYMADGSRSESRMSANTLNYTTLLLDNLPLWKDYPKRSKSFICSVDAGSAHGYGNLFQIYPINGCKIGVCPQRDLWQSFMPLTNAVSSVDDLNYFIESIIKFYTGTKPSETDYNSLVSSLSKIDARNVDIFDADQGNLRYNMLGYRLFDLFRSLKQRNMFDFVKRVLNPVIAGFKLVKSGDKFPVTKYGNEVWMEGPILMRRGK